MQRKKRSTHCDSPICARKAALRLGPETGRWLTNLLGEAQKLWRGEALADVPSEMLRRDEIPRLEELRLQAAEWRIEAGLQEGRHAELVSELQSLTACHPLRERFQSQLMLALVRCGRQAEALDAFERARNILVNPNLRLLSLRKRATTCRFACPRILICSQ